MYIPPMIIPKQDGCCDKQKLDLPCCENLMAIYPPGGSPCKSPRWKRRYHSRRRRRPLSPKQCNKIIKVPFPMVKYKYLDPIRVPDLSIPPLPPPPPRRPRRMLENYMMNDGGMRGGKYCNCNGRGCSPSCRSRSPSFCAPSSCNGCGTSGHPHYKCVCKKY